MRRFYTGMVLALLLPAMLAFGASIYWEDGDGGSATIPSAGWNDIQDAISLADNTPATPGIVKLEGDFQRSAGDTTVGDLNITNANLTLSGGWDASFTTQSGQSTLDANGNEGGTSADWFRVVRIAAANCRLENLVITKGRPNKTQGGGIYVSASGDNGTFTNLVVTDNYCHGTYASSDGGGMFIDEANGVRISHCDFTGNQAQVEGGGIFIQDSGTAANPVILEDCYIYNNQTTKSNYEWRDNRGGGIRIKNNSSNPSFNVVLARCRVIKNRSRYGSGIFSVSYVSGSYLTIFGSVISTNYYNSNDANKGTGEGLMVSGNHITRVVNSTVTRNIHPTDNTRHGVYATVGSWNKPGRLVFVNSIVADNNKGCYTMRRNGGAGPSYSYTDFQHSTVNEDNFYEYDADEANKNYTTLAAAISDMTNPTRAYAARNASGTLSTNMEANIQGNPLFLDEGPDPYQLSKATANCKDNGLTRVNSGYTYVDVNYDRNYDAMTDIIVDGTPPGGNHLVYKTDLLGNNRIDGPGLDRGAYEFIFPKGTIIIFK